MAKKRKRNSSNAIISTNINGWLSSKKGGLYKRTGQGTIAIFKQKDKWKTFFHSPSEGLTFFEIPFDSMSEASLYFDTHSMEDVIEYSKEFKTNKIWDTEYFKNKDISKIK